MITLPRETEDLIRRIAATGSIGIELSELELGCAAALQERGLIILDRLPSGIRMAWATPKGAAYARRVVA